MKTVMKTIFATTMDKFHLSTGAPSKKDFCDMELAAEMEGKNYE